MDPMRQNGEVLSFDPALGRGVIIGTTGAVYPFTTFELRASDRDLIAAGRAVSFTQISVDGATSLEDIAVDPGNSPTKDQARAPDMAEQLALRGREIACLRREIALRQQIQDLLAAAPKPPGQSDATSRSDTTLPDAEGSAPSRIATYWRHVRVGIIPGRYRWAFPALFRYQGA